MASRTVLAADADGREFELTLRVGRPYAVSLEEWACPHEMRGLHDRLPDMHGIDLWQCVQLVLKLQRHLLDDFTLRGGKLMWLHDRDPITPAELFS